MSKKLKKKSQHYGNQLVLEEQINYFVFLFEEEYYHFSENQYAN